MDRRVERTRKDGDELVVFHHVSWREYERRLADPDRIGLMSYLDGDLEIVTRGTKHERVKSHIGRLLEAYMEETGLEYSISGEWTQRNKHRRVGAEADESYILHGDHRRRQRFDLAIEVKITSGGIRKLEVYRRLNIKEVWFWIDGEIQVFVLRRTKYERVTRSEWLPELDLAELATFIPMVPSSAAVRAYRKALRARR